MLERSRQTAGGQPTQEGRGVPGVWQRTKNIFQAKANRVLDRAEDPRETLDLSYEKQLDSLQKVRRSVADVATARKRIELQAQQIQKQADKLQDQAKAALSIGNEDLAREALSRRAALGEQLNDLKSQHEQVVQQEESLVATSQRLQTQIEQFRTRKETLKASYTAAEAQTKVGEAVSGISTSMGDAGAAMQRAQDKIASMQARAGAMDELIASGALTDLTTPVTDIQAELDKAQAGSQVENELAALRAQLSAAGPTGALPSSGQAAGTSPSADAAAAADAGASGASQALPPVEASPAAPSADQQTGSSEDTGEDTGEGDAPVDGEPVTIAVTTPREAAPGGTEA
jgi:phage shock protein A